MWGRRCGSRNGCATRTRRARLRRAKGDPTMGDEQVHDPARPSAESDVTVTAASGTAVDSDQPDVSLGELSDPDLESVTGGYFSADPDLQPGY